MKGQAYNEGLGAINVKVGTQQTNIIVHNKVGTLRLSKFILTSNLDPCKLETGEKAIIFAHTLYWSMIASCFHLENINYQKITATRDCGASVRTDSNISVL